jgi:hypothetical protein
LSPARHSLVRWSGSPCTGRAQAGFIESTDDAYVGGEVTTLSAKVAGFIEAVTVVDNQSVKAGDLLLKLEDRDYRAMLARAEASVALQRATLANIDANRRMHQAVVEQASADVGGAAAELARTKYDLDRYRTLSNDRIASFGRPAGPSKCIARAPGQAAGKRRDPPARLRWRDCRSAQTPVRPGGKQFEHPCCRVFV